MVNRKEGLRSWCEWQITYGSTVMGRYTMRRFKMIKKVLTIYSG